MEISWLQAPCCIWHWPQWPGSAGALLPVHRGNSVSVLELLRAEGTHLGMAVHSKQQKKGRCFFKGLFECLFSSKQKVATRQVSSSGLLNDSHSWMLLWAGIFILRTGASLLCLARNLYQVFPSKLHVSWLTQLFQVRSVKTFMLEGLQGLNYLD